MEKKSVSIADPNNARKSSVWKHRINDVTEMRIVGSENEIETKSPFKPEYMHTFFGDDEEIDGYKQPKLKIYFNAYSFKMFYKFEYTEKRDESKTNKGILLSLPPTPIIEKIKPYLPENAITSDINYFNEQLNIDRFNFKPFGDVISIYYPSDIKPSDSSNNNNNSNIENEVSYEVRWCKFITNDETDEQLVSFHSFIQFFVLLEIDGGTFIETTDPRWEIYLVYEKRKENPNNDDDNDDGKKSTPRFSYSLIGYCTAYQFYAHPDKFRLRVSQFLLFPPYQRCGHGRNLLKAIYKDAFNRNAADIPVEDPAPDFTRLRDIVDMELIIRGNYFSPSQKALTPSVTQTIITAHRLWRKQIRRCFEIYRLNFVNRSNEEEYKEYRMYVKKRLFLENREQLELFPEGPERKEELNRIYLQLEGDYLFVISKLKHQFLL